MFKSIKSDIDVVMQKDPAARSRLEVFLTYPGIKAMISFRMAHWLYFKKLRFLARYISYRARKKTGIDIHPAATIGKGLFIDHGSGVVIGETAIIGDNVTLYQGVTLGGTGKETGKRHPTIGNNVMVSSGAKILGNITIGDYSKIGANSVVFTNVPEHSTVVGIPGKVVRMYGKKVEDLEQNLPDPILDELRRLNNRIKALEAVVDVKSCKYSMADDLPAEEE
ncbi:MAG: serine O-acetyltransferase [Firmicutes bacterium]|nr:serine O-acetyltransferase [Bacillota bacterium]